MRRARPLLLLGKHQKRAVTLGVSIARVSIGVEIRRLRFSTSA
jgi:hypothetical protein